MQPRHDDYRPGFADVAGLGGVPDASADVLSGAEVSNFLLHMGLERAERGRGVAGAASRSGPRLRD